MRHNVVVGVACFAMLVVVQAAAGEELRVMTFNLWVGGAAGGEPLERSVEAIRLAEADIVGLQETHGREVDGVRVDNGPRIAKALGWHYLDQGGRTGILSRFPIRQSTPSKWGARIAYADDRELMFFNAHFPASPYQPYQLLNIPYGDAPFIDQESQAIEWAQRSRGKQLDRLLQELEPAIASELPVVLTGDFNEPSFQDWTARAAAAGACPLKVEFPTTRRVVDAGMVDAWRQIFPDEVRHPGLTWTPLTLASDPKDHHDRIDFVFVSRRGVRVTAAQCVGEEGGADLWLDAWPSDHRAVVATIEIDD
ncbi:MAG: endonuclease/exonuclease/phosphatase family protein [Novipirellula sp. JB048]